MHARLNCTLLATLFTAVALAFSGSPLRAHYLWVAVVPQGTHGTARVIFEEGPAPRDGHYLPPIVERGEAWVRTLESNQPHPLELSQIEEDGKRWLSSELEHAGPRSVESSVEWGTYQYGEVYALLYYYAKFLDAADHDAMHELGRSEYLKLDIVPHHDQSTMELTVLWDGEPAAGLRVYVRGPQNFRTTLDTDDEGQISFDPPATGRYTMRTTRIDASRTGTYDGQAYQQVRDSCTLVMRIQVPATADQAAQSDRR